MTPQRFTQVRNLFEAALERDADARQAFVVEACRDDQELYQEVARLLDAHGDTVTMRRPAGAVPPIRTDPAAREGHRLGDYEILRLLGRGGMGSVYLARRADEAFQKSVAIKILRPDAATSDFVHRFHREREILAQLDHPNIARLLDAGSTGNDLPYFVMEYVEGRSITQYADDSRLTVRDRIALFQQVCDAVDYAHQRKIVHRDLKPGNVLVTAQGQVKLLDFGIAGLLDKEPGIANLTRSGMVLMTPEYASPEQIRGESVGRASDVYTLGVILFELLTGHRPYRLRSRVFHDVVRVVCEVPPTRPSTVIGQPVEIISPDGKPATLPPETASRLRQTSMEELRIELSGDLDNIVLKALQKQSSDRYASPMQLSSDLSRHLRGEAVWARADSLLYRAGKLLSRHALSVFLLCTVAAAVASGTVRLSWGALAWAGGAAALLGLWKAATDRKTAQRLQGSTALPALMMFFYAMPLILLVLLAYQLHLNWRWAFVVFYGIWGILAALGGAAWTVRKRWSGALLLDCSINRNRKIMMTCYGLACAAMLMSMLDRDFDAHSLKDTWNVPVLLCMIAVAFFAGRQEVRQGGIIAGVRFIRWSRVSSWAFETSKRVSMDGKAAAILVLHLHRRFRFLPPIRLPVSESQKGQIGPILTKQLGDWPGGS